MSVAFWEAPSCTVFTALLVKSRLYARVCSASLGNGQCKSLRESWVYKRRKNGQGSTEPRTGVQHEQYKGYNRTGIVDHWTWLKSPFIMVKLSVDQSAHNHCHVTVVNGRMRHSACTNFSRPILRAQSWHIILFCPPQVDFADPSGQLDSFVWQYCRRQFVDDYNIFCLCSALKIPRTHRCCRNSRWFRSAHRSFRARQSFPIVEASKLCTV